MGLFDVVFGAKRRVRIGAEGFFGFELSSEFLPAGAVELDACLNEVHTSTAEVTKHPVERGADIGDNIRVQPETLSITGVVSNTPLIFLASTRESPTRAEEAYDKLRELLRNAEPLMVITTLRQYENMVLTNMQTNRDARTGNVVSVQLNFEEIIIADSETVAAPEPEEDAASSAETQNAGKQGTEEAAAGADAQAKSVLSSLLGAF